MSKNKVIFTRALVCDANHLIIPNCALQLLSVDEQIRFNKIQHTQQAKLFLLGRYLLRHLLAAYLQQAPNEIHISIDDKGKPQLLDSPWHFNISHSGSLLALAFGNGGPLGVDVESRSLSSPQVQRLARRYFSEHEQQWLSQSHSSERFLQLWTIKEAVLKAHGSGIANNLSAVQWQPRENIAYFNKQPYQLHLYQVQQSRVTLALHNHQENVTAGCDIDLLNLADLPIELEITGQQPNLSDSV